MPIPAPLLAMIRQMGDAFDPSALRAEYALNRDAWRDYLDLLEMDPVKLPRFVVPHDEESPEKLALRQKLAAIFNYVPLIVKMTVNYLHSEQPTFDVKDETLKAFIDNCNGGGMSLVQYIRREVLPLALALGWVDVLVQNPATAEGMFTTAADEQAAPEPLSPRVFTITPLDRTNWSARQDHSYQWVRFRDRDNENDNPFIVNPVPTAQTYVTVSGFVRNGGAPLLTEGGAEFGFWVRSWIDPEDKKQKEWSHDGDWLPTRRCPVATLYYSQSIDPERRHFGVSKIAMIAILTKKLIQLLSWSDEQVLSNLALFVFPGDEPKNDKGEPVPVKLSPFAVIWLGNDAKVDPRILQGDTGHISIIWEIIDAYTREILRLAYLIGASAEAEQITSGVQGVVARTELFQELSDLAGSLDRFGLETLALAASLINGEDIDVEGLIARYKPTVNYYKGNYSVDPLKDVIANAQALIDTFADISPAMVQATYRQLAQTALYNEDAARDDVFREIRENFARVQADRQAQRDALLTAANAAAAGAASNTTTATEPGAVTPPQGTPAAPPAP